MTTQPSNNLRQQTGPDAPRPVPTGTSPNGIRAGARFVTVACKVPVGIELQLQTQEEWTEETMTGGRPRKRWTKHGDIIRIRGTAVPNGQAPAGYTRPNIVGGYALTHNVPADFWAKWYEQNEKTDLVKNGLLFAYSARDDLMKAAKERKDVLSGLEPLIPDTDRRVPRPVSGSIIPVATADEFQGFEAAAEKQQQ